MISLGVTVLASALLCGAYLQQHDRFTFLAMITRENVAGVMLAVP